ncbi:hypothetical protein K402DRAFT_445853 [Aulographum hederae CBS 113979]|uniref:RING-type E3 ubiquitin transferase n=1 Tax=Aulographum hederae CBS 113979 TaxID=1176131 RepID=A0A6G1H3W4_9PEZI|nr:hypothetical protein K402DRAFT_445853 [Aulographum hederae CBS 113979]
MASENTPASGPEQAPSQPAPPQGPAQRGGRPFRGRGRGGPGAGRGRGGEIMDGDSQQSNNRNRGGQRGGNRGRGGGRGNAQAPRESARPQPAVPPPLGVPASPGISGLARLTGNAKNEGEEGGEDEVEAEVCFICASPVVHNSIAPCNHRTCHICALRMRALYKNKACLHCRTQADYVVFTDSPSKRYEDFSASDFSNKDDNLGIQYESSDIFEDTVLLLRYNCPDGDCDVACLGWPDLHRHVKSVHHKAMCDLCSRNKKVFTHEHELFTQNELRKHEKFGDDNPGAIDQSGFKGHPECGFCRQRFYGDDELYEHCRDKHERCHICDRRDQGRKPQYYVDYNSLEQHFKSAHFLCQDQECLEKKFVVFDSETELKVHQMADHPNGVTRDRRGGQRVTMNDVSFRDPYDPRSSRRENRGGRGRGRDPNVEPIPMSSAQPLRRDELAYQRQLAIQSSQSLTPRTFGGQLTAPDPVPARARPAPAAQNASTAPARPRQETETFPSLGSVSNALPNQPAAPARDLTPQEQARQLRHNAITARAATMLKNDPAKLSTFRSSISSYRNSTIEAPALIDAFFALFEDTSPANLGTLIKELADIFELPAKRDSLLKAWNDWKAINEDYPSLPGPSGAGGTSMAAVAGAGSGGSRVLKLKSSTAQSSRSPISRSTGWGSAGAVPSTSNNNTSAAFSASTAFPPLSSNRVGAGRAGPTPWASSSASASQRPSPNTSAAPSRTGTPGASNGRSAPGMNNRELFPSLPAAKKPTTTVFSPGYSGRAIRAVDAGRGQPVANAWAASGSGGGSNGNGGDAATGTEEEAGESAKGKKGGKKKFQTLSVW